MHDPDFTPEPFLVDGRVVPTDRVVEAIWTLCDEDPRLRPIRDALVTDYHNWRGRQFDPLTRVADAAGATPYTLRHSFASLLVKAGWNALEISHEMCNSPEVVQRDYSHLFREFARGERLNPEQTIAAARRVEAGRA